MEKEFNKLENRAICMNGVHNYINDVVPRLIKELEKGFKLTNDFQLFKKDKERIYKIVESIPQVRAFLRVSEFSIVLNVDDNYTSRKPDKNGCSSCTYYKQYAYVWDVKNSEAYEFKPLEMVTKEQLEMAEKELEELEKEKSKIEGQIRERSELLFNKS